MVVMASCLRFERFQVANGIEPGGSAAGLALP